MLEVILFIVYLALVFGAYWWLEKKSKAALKLEILPKVVTIVLVLAAIGAVNLATWGLELLLQVIIFVMSFFL